MVNQPIYDVYVWPTLDSAQPLTVKNSMTDLEDAKTLARLSLQSGPEAYAIVVMVSRDYCTKLYSTGRVA